MRFKKQGLDPTEVQDGGMAPHNYEGVGLEHYRWKLSASSAPSGPKTSSTSPSRSPKPAQAKKLGGILTPSRRSGSEGDAVIACLQSDVAGLSSSLRRLAAQGAGVVASQKAPPWLRAF